MNNCFYEANPGFGSKTFQALPNLCNYRENVYRLKNIMCVKISNCIISDNSLVPNVFPLHFESPPPDDDHNVTVRPK